MDRILNELFGDTSAPQAPTPATTTDADGTMSAPRTDADREARREARQQRKQDAGTQHRHRDFIDRYTTGSPSEGFSTDEAMAHLRELRQDLGPAEFRAALQQTLEHLPPDQRDEFIAMMRQHRAQRTARDSAGGASPAAASAAPGTPAAGADAFGGLLTGLMGGGAAGTGSGGAGDLLDQLATGGSGAPAMAGQSLSAADMQALLQSPVGKAILGGIAAYGLQGMQTAGGG